MEAADGATDGPGIDFMVKLAGVYPHGYEALVLPVIYPDGK